MHLEAAEAALKKGDICDGCLGRCFGDRDDDLSNEARGEALRRSVAMGHDEPIAHIDPIDCWVCEGARPDVNTWTARVIEAVADITFETFQVGTRLPSSIEEREAELREAAGLEADAGVPLNTEYNRAVGTRLEGRLDAEVDFDYPDVVMILDVESADVELQLNPAYLGGRYRKLEPGLDQRIRICRVCNGGGTEWRDGQSMPCDACDGTGYDTKESIEWYITESVQDAMDGTEVIFNAAGREDKEVLVLGEGRPFVIEVKEARFRPPDMTQIRELIATASDQVIAVDGLAKAKRGLVEHLTQTPVRETYRLEVSFAEAVSAEAFATAIEELDEGSVRQRVERGERVTDQIRKLSEVGGELTNDKTAVVEMVATKGISLEALMVGGSDRSEPSLADLVASDVSLESIAVVAVDGEDEPLELTSYLIS